MSGLATERMRLAKDLCTDKTSFEFPERVIQIGEGNFLRGFVDWMIHQLNKNGLFRGRIVVAAPRPTGAQNIERLNTQDGLFTVWLRGILKGNQVDHREIISSVSRGVNPYQNWEEFLQCAENPKIEIVVSNTTESGLQYTQEELQEGVPLSSFPAKLTAYLYHRYCHFHGEGAAGMTIVPCELVDNNGDKLRELVLRHAADWKLPNTFLNWLHQSNHFCNTLVDRIVTGFPQGEEGEQLLSQLSYRDELLTIGEPFHLWAIEADERLEKVWPFEKIGLHVPYVSDVSLYRTQKVRILNGAHTAMSALGLLSGLHTVGETVNHPILGVFVRNLIEEEIVPALLAGVGGANQKEIGEFASSVLDRFGNPFVRHELQSLTLNGLSKIRVRLLPTLHDFYVHTSRVPVLLAAALASQLLFYRTAVSEGDRFTIRDDAKMMEIVAGIWGAEENLGLAQTVSGLLRNHELWGEDLDAIHGLREEIVMFIQQVRSQGVLAALGHLVRTIDIRTVHNGGEMRI